MMGGAARHEEEVRAGRVRFQQACAAHAQRDHTRRAALAQLESDNHRRAGEVTAHKRAVATGAPDAVVIYVDLVLTASLYPDAFPQHWRLAYVPESRQLVIEYDLPGIGPSAMLDALSYLKAARAVGVPGALEVSRSGTGAHVWVVFEGPVRAEKKEHDADSSRRY